MKRMLFFALGLLVGFLGIETLSAPKPVTASRRATSRAANPAKGNDPGSDSDTTTPMETESLPATGSAVTTRPATERPGVFFFTAPTNLYGTAEARRLTERLQAEANRALLRNDAAFMADFRALVQSGLENDLQVRRYLTRLDPVKFSQVVAIATEQVIDRNLMTTSTREESLAASIQLSRENAPKLAAVLSPAELETWAEFSYIGSGEIFRLSTEAFAKRGLALPTREELEALTAPQPRSGTDGRMYLTRVFDPTKAPDSMNSQQRAYLANLERWNRAQMIISNLHSTKVRAPDVWEIWPD